MNKAYLLWLVVALLLAGVAAIVWLLSTPASATPSSARKRFDEALESADDGDDWLSQRQLRSQRSMTTRFKRLLERTPGTDMAEVDMLIRRLGWLDDRRRSLAYTSMWLLPAAGGVLGFVWGMVDDDPALATGLMGAIAGFLISRRALRWAAERRQQLIRSEMPTVLNLLRMLFDSGLSLEHSLKTVAEQGHDVSPHLAHEFQAVLQRIYHGQDRGDALEDMARHLDVMELTETVAILKQSARYGGNLRDSLLKYLRLLEDRRMTDLREKVSKLSAKMTIVMVLFMFPALMIFLAGPGVMSITRMLSQIK
jgi:tight adherence protein C